MGLTSVGKRKKKMFTRFSMPVDPAAAAAGAGGARGPIARIAEQEALWQEKNEKLRREADAEMAQRRRESSRISEAIGNRSVDEWRDQAFEGFVNRAASRPVSGSSSKSAPAAIPARPSTQLPPLPPGCAQSKRRGRQPRLKPGYEGLTV